MELKSQKPSFSPHNIFGDKEKYVGDGVCEFGTLSVNMDQICNYDGNDCAGCEVENPHWLGYGNCNGGDYDTLECKFDYEDCLKEHFPNFTIDVKSRTANRKCDG